MSNSTTNKLTLIKRSAPTCPQCITMQLALEDANIPFNTIDIAKEPEAIEKYDLSSVPVLLIDNGGKTIKLNGVQPVEVIKEFLED
ncbi:glutaredoxin family protein [Sporosarcina sp. FSL W7-1283]|uniref:glutaredoxin family protein n=1 Tax=Sporosarcina sp. FSL W7-1283 TaxID=2921560 RepID=UPI0030FC9020